MEHIDAWLESSDAPGNTREAFDALVARIPHLPTNPKYAAIIVKESLGREGFSYNGSNFLAQDVFVNRSGNCLGLPLLVGSILGKRGFTPRFGIIVNPHDSVSELEENFRQKIEQKISSEGCFLCTVPEESSFYRFAPLEHLVVDTDGKFLLETTSKEHPAKGYESARRISFDEGLSCVLKDRAIIANSKGDSQTAKSLAYRGLSKWKDNRQLHVFLAEMAAADNKDAELRHHLMRFEEIDGKDSLFYFDKYLLTGDETQLDVALKKYPSYAQAMASKANLLAKSHPDKSRQLFSVASHLYANSSSLSLRNFFATYHVSLGELFGKSAVRAGLRGEKDTERTKYAVLAD